MVCSRRGSRANDRPTPPEIDNAANPETDVTIAAPTQERILNQDEIDSLLGFDVGDGDNQDKSGIRAIINSALVSYERLPMLEIVFDRLVRLMTTSLRNFTSDNVEVSLDSITSTQEGDLGRQIEDPGRDPLEETERNERERRVEDAVAQLPEYQRSMIV